MPKTAFNWKIVGQAGEGIKSTGLILSKTLLRHGLYTFDYTEYPSLIRGGHNTYQVFTSTNKVYSQEYQVDLLISLDKAGLSLHRDELTPNSLTLFDGSDLHLDLNDLDLPGTVISVPFFALAREAGGERVMGNNVALGVTLFLIGLDLSELNLVIADAFGGKKGPVVDQNQKVAEAGFNYAKVHLKPIQDLALTSQPQVDHHTLTGNEAIALGLIAGGLKAYIAYPMTPASSILHFLAEWQTKANIFVKHAEDEIGVINMALGMSFAGVRTAVGTSGGGFCYMTEAVGFSGVAELPLVIVESQRPGPALGMPTWTAQADLLFMIHASQDEFPRIILAPGDVTEAFSLAKLSLSLAEDYQIPVILLADKHLSESAMSCTLPAGPFSHHQTSVNLNPKVDETGFYPRYQTSGAGITLRSLPGTKDGFYSNSSYEHDIHGLGSELASDRLSQTHKRFSKLAQIESHLPAQFYDGSKNPQITLIGFGSTKTVLHAAALKLRASGIDAAVFNLSWLWPFPINQVKQVLQLSQNPVIIEGNHDHQLAQLVRAQTGLDVYHKRVKYDGRPFYPYEIIQYAHEILGK